MDHDNFDQVTKPERLWSRSEVLAKSSPVPRGPGLYAWYFKGGTAARSTVKRPLIKFRGVLEIPQLRDGPSELLLSTMFAQAVFIGDVKVTLLPWLLV